jgi:O-antigen ligase
VSVVADDRSGVLTTPAVGLASGRRFGEPVRLLQVYVVLLILIPSTQIIGPLGAVGTPATVLGLVALALWAFGVLAPGDYLRRTVVPVRIMLGFLILAILTSYAVLHTHFAPVDESLSSDRMLLQVSSWAGVALLAAEGLRDRDELYQVLRTLTAAVATMAIVGLLQFRFGIDLAEWAKKIPGLHPNTDLVSIQARQGFRRPAGTTTHPIEFGCIIAMALPLALHLARFDEVRPRFRRWLLLAAIAIGVPVAVSRSAVLAAVVVGVVIFVGLEPRARPRALALGAAFVVMVYATTPGLLGALRNLFVYAGSDSSISYRTGDYALVGEHIRQSPWFGRGPGTFLSRDYFMILDNQYLLSTIEIGLVGLTAVVCYLFAAAFLGRGARHRSGDPRIRDLGQALAAASVASAVAALTFDAFSFLAFAGTVPVCLGAAGALWATTRVPEHAIDAVAPATGLVGDLPPRELPLSDRLRDDPGPAVTVPDGIPGGDGVGEPWPEPLVGRVSLLPTVSSSGGPVSPQQVVPVVGACIAVVVLLAGLGLSASRGSAPKPGGDRSATVGGNSLFTGDVPVTPEASPPPSGGSPGTPGNRPRTRTVTRGSSSAPPSVPPTRTIGVPTTALPATATTVVATTSPPTSTATTSTTAETTTTTSTTTTSTTTTSTTTTSTTEAPGAMR